MQEPRIAFAVRTQESPAIEIRVNFGVFAGREATPAEIDRLAEWLLDEHAEASVHQVRVEVAHDRVPDGEHDREQLEERLVERADHWARTCIAERHAEVAEL